MRYMFIINSKCNPKELRKLENAIAALDDNTRALIELRYTEYPGHAMEIASEISDQYDDKATIVVCGGDGTLHEVVNGVAYRSTTIVVIPLGSSNDFARSVLPPSIFSNPTKIVSMLGDIRVVPIDLIRIDSYDVLGNHIPMWSRFCVNVASIGIDTEMMLLVEEKLAKKGKNRFINKKYFYFGGFLKQFKPRSFKLDYNLELVNSETNEISENEEFFSISICNGRYYGSGFLPAPGAKLDDGKLDICAIEKMGWWDTVKTFFKYRNGKHVDAPGVRTFKATSGIITCKDNSFQLLGNSDGAVFHGHRIRFEIFPEELNIGIIPNEKT